MIGEQLDAQGFLTELYNMTEGDTDKQVSMYDVGAVLGLDKSAAGAVAEDLMVDGYAELVSLSGGISITRKGLKELNIDLRDSPDGGVDTLGSEAILTETDRQAVEETLATLRNCVSGPGERYEIIEQIVIDIKTIEVQLLSSHAKTEIIREILKSIKESMVTIGNQAVSDHLSMMIGG